MFVFEKSISEEVSYLKYTSFEEGEEREDKHE